MPWNRVSHPHRHPHRPRLARRCRVDIAVAWDRQEVGRKRRIEPLWRSLHGLSFPLAGSTSSRLRASSVRCATCARDAPGHQGAVEPVHRPASCCCHTTVRDGSPSLAMWRNSSACTSSGRCRLLGCGCPRWLKRGLQARDSMPAAVRRPPAGDPRRWRRGSRYRSRPAAARPRDRPIAAARRGVPPPGPATR